VESHFYRSGQFARRAGISIRTLRYYDSVGLLSPSGRSEAGYRLYTEADFTRLRHILALKYLGLSLEQIKDCLQMEQPLLLRETLALQKARILEKKAELEAVLQVFEDIERLLSTRASRLDWELIDRMVAISRITQSNSWNDQQLLSSYLQQLLTWLQEYDTPEKRQQLIELGRQFDTPENRQRFTSWIDMQNTPEKRQRLAELEQQHRNIFQQRRTLDSARRTVKK
jgi:DNA-binding transcriptional MerR regulator